MKKIIRKVINLISDESFDYTIKHARGLRNISDEKIQSMKADLNGCDDKYFLMLEIPLDQCVPSDEELERKK